MEVGPQAFWQLVQPLEIDCGLWSVPTGQCGLNIFGVSKSRDPAGATAAAHILPGEMRPKRPIDRDLIEVEGVGSSREGVTAEGLLGFAWLGGPGAGMTAGGKGCHFHG
ncbi:MAG TPA: hypothetical protein VN203_02645, partial [Candidatus Acidoferrum sp.]|nr:hypothetical protein [Candidatus Acidoferrum sp.]